MHKLRCGDLRDSDRNYQLHELHRGRVLNISRGLGIVNVHRLCRGQLRSEHGIDDMHSLQHGRLLNSER